MAMTWYPGHMKTARRQMAEAMPKIDAVIEVVDARLPVSSGNPILAQMRQRKPCLMVLNKADLADPLVTKRWIAHFEHQGKEVRALALNATRAKEVTLLPKLCRSLVPHRGIPGKPLRVMVVGIPNVGKSTLINTLAGRRIAKVGNQPAITRSAQQVDLRNGLLLFDTPGILWPDPGDELAALRLAASGAIGNAAMDYHEVGRFAAAYLLRHYPDLLCGRYNLSFLPADGEEVLTELGRRRGCLEKGGEVDYYRAAEIFLRELQSGKIGRISFEAPDEIRLAGEKDS
ncbi:MAG: ribosome biogenesis GTPase YlqF [Syntrophotaleaceae bacterium]